MLHRSYHNISYEMDANVNIYLDFYLDTGRINLLQIKKFMTKKIIK